MKELNLCLHAGSHHADLEQVARVRTPEPAGVWHPIPHIDLHTSILRAVEALQLRVITQVHALACNGDRYFGLYQVANGHENDHVSLVIGTRNSHDKKFVAGIACGEGVFVCDNLAFSAEVVLGRKHTTHIVRDLPQLCDKAVGLLAERWSSMEERVTTYRAHPIADERAHDLIIRSVDAGALTPQSIPGVLQEWRTPSHPELAADGKTAWRLFNAFTENYKSIGNPARLMHRSQILHGLMDTECGILSKDRVIDVTSLATN